MAFEQGFELGLTEFQLGFGFYRVLGLLKRFL